MNAPATNLPRTKAWERYLPVLAFQMPGRPKEEQRERCGLLALRDLASQAKHTANYEAWAALDAVETVAAHHALLADTTLEQLRGTRIALGTMWAAATSLGQIFPVALSDG